ncbi:hypothetical protein [Streptomyces sp. NPDC054834]
MNHFSTAVHTVEELSGHDWPAGTQAVTRLDDAWVLNAAGDFDADDLDLVRRQFPHHRVTLDGDVITIWPRPAAQR